MLTLDDLRSQQVVAEPFWQRFFATIIRWDHRRSGTEVVIEGLEYLPTDRKVFFAMNHTDRFNSIPFQVGIARRGRGWTATWVKPKYYEHPALAWFMRATNQIPLPSRGWLATARARAALRRRPTDAEYRALRDLLGGSDEPLPTSLSPLLAGRPVAALRTALLDEFSLMMAEVLRLDRQALHEAKLDVVVFPEGTRSRRLGAGHTGLAQVSQWLGATIVPVGCSGNDHLYPGDWPFSAGGRVVYRVGAPLEPDGPALARHRVNEPFEPFSFAAEHRHGQAFQAITEVVMGHLADLVDAGYRSEDGATAHSAGNPSMPPSV